MSRIVVAVAVAAVVAVLGRPVTAHHSFAAQYDRDKTDHPERHGDAVEWMNPHVYFYLDVKDAAGAVALGDRRRRADVALPRRWRKDSLKAGDVVTVHGFLARDGIEAGQHADRRSWPTAARCSAASSTTAPTPPKPPGR